MFGRAISSTLHGIEAVRVDIESQISGSTRRFAVVGLPDAVLKEAKERVRCAIENSGFAFPSGELVIHLSPAALPKAGAGFDLAIALSILAASGELDPLALNQHVVLGELALDGSVRAARGALGAAFMLRERRELSLLVPQANAQEACLVQGVEVRAISSLRQAVDYLNARLPLEPEIPKGESASVQGLPTFQDVIGQHDARRALEISAAGGHNLLMVGPPGSGKSMLAARLPCLLKALDEEEMIEVSRIHEAYAAAAQLNAVGPRALISRPPFRAPHHSTSTAGLIGGGSTPVPGEVSLAHRGVLFLDEVTEMRREALEALRQPLESKQIVISRAKSRLRFPCDFIFLAAMNPCPCGKRGLGKDMCKCAPWAISRYTQKISGPIADRIDLQIWVPPVPLAELQAISTVDPTAEMQSRVRLAEQAQRSRSSKHPRNSQLGTTELKQFCRLDQSGNALLEKASERHKLSARAYTRVLKVARTVADLEQSEQIKSVHIAEVLRYRIAIA